MLPMYVWSAPLPAKLSADTREELFRRAGAALARWYLNKEVVDMRQFKTAALDLFYHFAAAALESTNVQVDLGLAAARAAALANTAAQLSHEPAPLLPTLPELMTLHALVAATARANELGKATGAGESALARAFETAANGAGPVNGALMHVMGQYWTARSFFDVAQGQQKSDLHNAHRNAGQAAAILRALLAKVNHPGLDYAALKTLCELCAKLESSLAQRVAQEKIRHGLVVELDKAPPPLVLPTPLTTQEWPLHAVHQFDRLLQAETDAGWLKLVNTSKPVDSNPPPPLPTPPPFEEAQAALMTDLLGKNARATLAAIPALERHLVLTIALRAALAERARWANVLLLDSPLKPAPLAQAPLLTAFIQRLDLYLAGLPPATVQL